MVYRLLSSSLFQLRFVKRFRFQPFLVLSFPDGIGSVLEMTRQLFAFQSNTIIFPGDVWILYCCSFYGAVPYYLCCAYPSMSASHITAILDIDFTVCGYVII